MHIQDTQDKFVELRAQGWTLAHIATELHVSKRTLVEWNREFAADIQSFRTVEQELLKEQFLSSREEELNRLARLQKDVDDELANRTLKFIPFEKLFRLATDLRHEIHALRAEARGDAEMPFPERERQNGNAHDGACRAKGRRVAQKRSDYSPVDANPSDSDEAIAAGLPPSPRVVEPSGRNGIHKEKPSKAGTASAPTAPDDRIAPAAPSPETPSPSDEPNGQFGLEARQPTTKAETEPAAAAEQTQEQPRLEANPQEHCLACGAELPALLSDGERPYLYCDCGQSLTLPGLSLLEHCGQCGVALPVHGYNAQRLSDTCPGCAATLPPLDPKSNHPWILPSLISAIQKQGKR